MNYKSESSIQTNLSYESEPSIQTKPSYEFKPLISVTKSNRIRIKPNSNQTELNHYSLELNLILALQT